MKVLFVTSEHPACVLGGLGTFTREYTRILRKKCNVITVYFHFSTDKSPESDADIDYVFYPRQHFNAYSAEARMPKPILSLCRVDTSRSVLPVLRRWRPDVCFLQREDSVWTSTLFLGKTP